MFGNSTEQPLFQERNHCKLITVSTHGAVCLPGGGYALPGLRSVRPVFNLFTVLAETAGVGGLKIAETFPAGRAARMDAG